MTVSQIKLVNFGKTRSGLSTVGYAIFTSAGSIFTARTTSGVYELTSSGIYGANIEFSDGFRGSIVWDTGEASNRMLVAAESIELTDVTDIRTLVTASILTQGTVISGSSIYNVYTTISASTDYYAGYLLRIIDPTSGNVSRYIDYYTTTSGVFSVDPAMPFVPTSGSVVLVLSPFDDKAGGIS